MLPYFLSWGTCITSGTWYKLQKCLEIIILSACHLTLDGDPGLPGLTGGPGTGPVPGSDGKSSCSMVNTHVRLSYLSYTHPIQLHI